MKFLISVPASNLLDGLAVVATGSGLKWKVSQVPMTFLMEEARKNARYENAELKVLSANLKAPAGAKLVFGQPKTARLWIDTKPYAAYRFVSGLAVILQEIQNEAGGVLGYVLAFPDGRCLRVAAADVYTYCENARLLGRPAIQNMQYVSTANGTASHLKNYEGRTVPVYIHRRRAVNAEKAGAAPKAPEAVPVPEKPTAQTVFTPEQLEVLGRGKQEGVDIRVYANPAYSPKHMDVIRNILVHKKDPSLLLNPKLPEHLVSFYGHDIVSGADIRPYFNPAYTVKQAMQVKLGVIRGLDVSVYASPTTDGDEMEQIRVRMDADMWSGITP